MRILFVVVAAILLQGCASAVVGGAIIAGGIHDRATQSNGIPSGKFMVSEEKYQFIPNTQAMTELCAGMLELKVGQFDRSKMKILHTRNLLTGISKCEASL